MTRFLNLAHRLALTVLTIILVIPLYIQFTTHQIPCPLCLLQRVGFLFIACGFLLNLRFGFYSSHYAVILGGSLYILIVAGTQMLLHIAPGDKGYGETFLNFHLYTLACAAGIGFIVYSAFLLSFEKQFSLKKISEKPKCWAAFTMIFSIIAGINLISTFAECVFSFCVSNPTEYQLFSLFA